MDKIVSEQECDYECTGDSALKCGGYWRMNVFEVPPEPCGKFHNTTHPYILNDFYKFIFLCLEPTVCAPDWSAYNGKCYKIFYEKMTFSEAEDYCNSRWVRFRLDKIVCVSQYLSL